MPERSAGLLLYRLAAAGPEVFLVHPGGPFWARKDDGAWSIPKGLMHDGEPGLEAARREFAEETGFAPEGAFVALGEYRQPSGKRVLAWAVEGDADPADLKSNEFTMEWPPRSGRQASFPEADRAGWFDAEAARIKLSKGQIPILDALLARLGFAAPHNR
ncbi:MAG: NUDIX domain-containing protein [Bauldia sp.]|nr:NUDIX domain-containing protein [Bauldia sp.]